MEWNESYELGISQLDEHHRHLVGLLKSAYESCLDDDPAESFETILKLLSNYASYHFSVEERLMLDNGYPEQQAHTKMHDLFIRQIARFQLDLFAGKGLLAMEMMVFLGKWLIDHILDVDRKLYIYLAAKDASYGLVGEISREQARKWAGENI